MMEQKVDESLTNAQSCTLSKLPQEVLKMIIEKLGTVDLLNCGAVSTLWCSSCTAICCNRAISLKFINSVDELNAFNGVFKNADSPIPWSSYHFSYDFINGLNDIDCYYLLKRIRIGAIEFSQCSIKALFAYIPDVHRIDLNEFYNLNKMWTENCDSVKELRVLVDNNPIEPDHPSYLLLKALCEHVESLDLMLFGVSGCYPAQRLTSIFRDVPSVSIATFMSNPKSCQLLVDGNLKIPTAKLDLDQTWEKLAYERLILSVSTLLRKITFFVFAGDEDTKFIKFPILAQLLSITFKFRKGWGVENQDNCQLESYFSDLTQSNVPVLKIMKLYYDEGDEQVQVVKVDLFNKESIFTSVYRVYVQSFDAFQLQLNFPNAIIIWKR